MCQISGKNGLLVMCVSVDDEFEKLVLRLNPPRVTVDNVSNKKATLIKVHSANKRGSLLEVVQVLTDLNLIIKRAYISSVFHVTDQQGNKVSEDNIAERIQQVSVAPGGRQRRFKTYSDFCLHDDMPLRHILHS